MSLPIIYLSELYPKYDIALPLNLPINDSEQASVTIKGCELRRGFFVGGIPIWILVLNGSFLQPNAALLGEIIIQGQQPRSILVSGHVADKSALAFVSPYVCLRFNGVRLMSSQGIELSARRLHLLWDTVANGLGSAVLLLKRISRPPDGSLFSLTAMSPHTSHIELAKAEVTTWSTFAPKPNDLLQIGDNKLQFEKGVIPSIEPLSEEVDFGVLKSLAQTVEFSFKNNRKRQARVVILSTVPWLLVTNNPVELPPSGIGTTKLMLTSDVRQLAKGAHIEYSGLYVIADNEIIAITARLKIEMLPPLPVMDNRPINLGEVYVGKAANLSKTFTIKNEGEMPWHGRIETNVPGWLAVEPSTFTLPPKEELTCLVSTTDGANSLGEGSPPNVVLRVYGDDYTFEKRLLLRLVHIPIKFRLNTQQLNYGEYRRGNGTRTETFTIVNESPSDIAGQVESMVDWLEVPSSRFKVGVGASITIGVILIEHVEAYPDGDLSESKAIWLHIDKATSAVPLSANVRLLPPPPRLNVSQTTLAFPAFQFGSLLPGFSFYISNEGPSEWTGVIHPSVPWLDVIPRGRITLVSDKQLLVSVHLNKQLPFGVGNHSASGIIRIGGYGQNISINATLNILPAHVKSVQPQEVILLRDEGFDEKDLPIAVLGDVTSDVAVVDFGDGIKGIYDIQSVNLYLFTSLKTTRVSIYSGYDWLLVMPNHCVLERDASQVIEIRVSLNTPLHEGENHFADAIRVVNDVGDLLLSLPVRIYFD